MTTKFEVATCENDDFFRVTGMGSTGYYKMEELVALHKALERFLWEYDRKESEHDR